MRTTLAPILFITLLAATLAACSWLPRAGPNRSDMMAAGNNGTGITVVELDSATVNRLSATRPASLLGAFGDYRPPQEQRIGIGETLQITQWEAGPNRSSPRTAR